ncbi:MAG TPA: complex I subunit 1 family protein [Vampirovibrionales bacterium]
MSISTSNLIKTFKKEGNLNLLDNYRGEKRKNVPVFLETIKLLLVIAFWYSAAFGAGLGIALVTLVITPAIFNLMGVPDGSLLKDFALATAPLAVVMGFVPVNAMFLVLLERKLLALLTTRLGPNRVGPNGLFQTFADALKLLFKEDIVPDKADKILFFLSPAIFFTPSVIVFLPIMSVAGAGIGPFAKTVFLSSLLFLVAVSSLAVMGLTMAGWSSNNKYSLIGGLRSTAQAISYEIPFVLSLVSFIVLFGSISLKKISDMQADGFLDWNIFGGGVFSNPENWSVLGISLSVVVVALMFLLAFMTYFCALAEVNRIPFDLPEAESELVSGYNTEFTGMKFALFFLAEYTNLFVISAAIAILFFGGTSLGIPFIDQFAANSLRDVTFFGNLSWFPGVAVLLFKTYLLIALAIWIRATLPRFRADQLMELAWKKLIPISLVSVLVAAVCKTFLTI